MQLKQVSPETAAGVSENFPAVQLVQNVKDNEEAYVPAEQSMQNV